MLYKSKIFLKTIWSDNNMVQYLLYKGASVQILSTNKDAFTAIDLAKYSSLILN